MLKPLESRALTDLEVGRCALTTGEPPFVKDSVGAFEAQAKTTGAKIVHCCGFDSEPSVRSWMADEGRGLMMEVWVREGEETAWQRGHVTRRRLLWS